MPPRTRTTLRFHTDLYPPPAIAAAVGMFADFAEIQTSRDGAYTVLDVLPTADVDGDLLGELCNFALANSVTMRAADALGAPHGD